jgi:hypothetical protein
MNSIVTALEISLQAVPSKLLITGGMEISFSRAILSMRNAGPTVVGLVPHATIAQEGGSVQDVSEALSQSRTEKSLMPGDILEWDIYDLLLSAHPGVASKVHLWGYKAVLNWWYNVDVWSEYRTPEALTPQHTSVFRWKLRWIPANSASEGVNLTIEAVTS